MGKAYQECKNRQVARSAAQLPRAAGHEDLLRCCGVNDGEHENAPGRVIDLEDVEVEDGPALARLVTRLRRTAEQGPPLVLVHCPQMLAHTLYKAGVLGAGRIRIGSMREEEPHAS
jgi:hypothetical protein